MNQAQKLCQPTFHLLNKWYSQKICWKLPSHHIMWAFFRMVRACFSLSNPGITEPPGFLLRSWCPIYEPDKTHCHLLTSTPRSDLEVLGRTQLPAAMFIFMESNIAAPEVDAWSGMGTVCEGLVGIWRMWVGVGYFKVMFGNKKTPMGKESLVVSCAQMANAKGLVW